MADQDRSDEEAPFADNLWNEPMRDDSDLWEETAPAIDGSDAQQTENLGWVASAPEGEGAGEEKRRTPPPRIRKRRIVCGVLFLILGLIGVLADGFDVDIEIAATMASLVGVVVLLAGLIASERRRRQIIQLS